MKFLIHLPTYLFLIILFFSCSSSDQEDSGYLRRHTQKGEYIYRKQNESLIHIPPIEKKSQKVYPWNKDLRGNFSKITKEFFRCKGSSLNPFHNIQNNGQINRQYDCRGSDKHSLPLKDGKEFIYPILIELVNYIQEVTDRHVVITSGHRCPEHNTYVDPKPANQYSKHMIGAEVSFYVQGLEEQPEQIVKIIQNFYKVNPRYAGIKEYEEFKRYEKKDTNVSTHPWMNKEIFLKLYRKKEGRNFDNRHPYPYLSVQVRHDRETNEKVTYTWDKAYYNYPIDNFR